MRDEDLRDQLESWLAPVRRRPAPDLAVIRRRARRRRARGAAFAAAAIVVVIGRDHPVSDLRSVRSVRAAGTVLTDCAGPAASGDGPLLGSGLADHRTAVPGRDEAWDGRGHRVP